MTCWIGFRSSALCTVQAGAPHRQHLVDQQLERSQPWESPAVQHEVINAQFDERTHLLDHLLWRADEAEVVVVVSAEAVASEVLGLGL